MLGSETDQTHLSLLQNNRATGRDLSNIAFDGLSLESPVFKDCTAADATFVGGELISSTWDRCSFSRCRFSSVDFAGASFENCHFFDANSASGNIFRFCELKEATFKSCDLTMATFSFCKLFDVCFHDCRMRGVVFEKPSFARSPRKARPKKPDRAAGTFEKCNLTDAILKGADFSFCSIVDCVLVNADLKGSSFVSSSLRGSVLTNASLHLVNLSGADLRGVDLSGLDLNELESFSAMKISAGQQHHLLRSFGIDVFPDGE